MRLLALVALVVLVPATSSAQIPGLQEPVEILRDAWGINHIYAENEHDLFLAQGYAAARDRLFQFEIWRRQSTGTVAEILGPREIDRDIGTRLFQFRGDIVDEMNYYHPRGAEIITAFVDGVNAYIDEARADPTLLPLEFELLGIQPEHWTPEVVISRHQGLLGNIGAELRYGRAVARLGSEAVQKHEQFGPGVPDLELDPAIDGEDLFDDILYFYNAYRRSVRFQPEDLAAVHRNSPEAFDRLASALPAGADVVEKREIIGSNNWVTDGSLSRSGFPVMANDPHRTLAVPSLRYWTHLVAPGWNVIGGGEPEIPGISIGHNEHGAWGLTVFQTDGEDLYVYETHPDDPRRYRYKDGWERMTVINDTIRVKGSAPVAVEHLYTRHGPVVYSDGGTAYAVRAAWMEVGGAPYLASLRMNQARTWEEFREACRYSHIPGENMIWAGRDGTIGWQAVGIAPVRHNWSGLVPVPGDGRYEWDGYLDILDKPHEVNPARGFIATANNELVPDGYPHRDAVGWEWSDPFRAHRAAEVLGSGQIFGLADHIQLQTDVLSIPARTLVPLLRPLQLTDPALTAARAMLLDWDHELRKDSGPAALYVLWERVLQREVPSVAAAPEAQELLGGLALSAIIDHLTYPGPEFASRCDGCNPLEGRDALLATTLKAAVLEAEERMGNDPAQWQYGAFKHADVDHALLGASSPSVAARLDCCDLPRGGNSYTLNNTSGGDNQRAGATFRIIVDTGDWDASVGMNAPGQSGDPDSPFYDNLFEHWARDQFFPVYFSRGLVEAAAVERVELLPANER